MSTLEQERAREGQLRRKVEELTRMIEMMCNEQAKLKEATRHLQEAEDQRAGERVKGEEQASATVKAQDRRVASTTPGTSTTSALDTPLRYQFTTEAGGRVTGKERAHVDTVKTQDRVLEFTALGATTAAAADTRSPTTAVALDTPVCMTKGNATTNTPLKGGARLANVSTTRSIKGNREQLERGQALKIFRDGYHTCPKVLIATDESVGSAEDIPTVDIVVCYDMPDTIDEYERRIGRARSNGMATSFLRRRSIGQSACRSALARGGRRRSAIM
jgi:hypothetical protein